MSRHAVVIVAMFFLVAAPARADGGPIAGGDAGPAGVTARGVADRYVAQSVPGGTLVLQIERRGGAIIDSRFLHGEWVVPMVAYDGSATGLSADGRTLVLEAGSRFAVLDTETLKIHRTVHLRGRFALDAISRDGTQLYLIQTLGPRYAVRRYDLVRRRLLRAPIVDPAEADEPMTGAPIARAASRDGRWAYTLYNNGTKAPFIHALDTQRGRARCVDLDALAGRDDFIDLRLRLAGDGAIVVRTPQGRTVLTVDPRSFAVRSPRAAAPPPQSTSTDWTAAVVGIVVLLLLGFGAVKLGAAGRRANFGH
jgi:hypothetical protein